MKIKNVKLEWYVLHYDINKNKVVKYNVFWDNWPEEIAKAIKSKSIISYKSIKSKEDLKVWLKRKFMYHYWGKCEVEMIVGPWPYKKEEDLQKVDIWMQLEPNLDIITDYVVQKMDIEFKGDRNED